MQPENCQRGRSFAAPRLLAARAAFVKMMKAENFYHDCNHNLKAHWRGKQDGFAVMHIQHRWQDFLAGYEAANDQAH